MKKSVKRNLYFHPKYSEKPITKSISVDASAIDIHTIEWRGVDTVSKMVLFSSKVYDYGTINIAEYIAIIHALAYCKKHKLSLPIYSDSLTALAWIKRKKHNSKLEYKEHEIFEILSKANFWLKSNQYENKILKWETNLWGENPADYKRK